MVESSAVFCKIGTQVIPQESGHLILFCELSFIIIVLLLFCITHFLQDFLFSTECDRRRKLRSLTNWRPHVFV